MELTQNILLVDDDQFLSEITAEYLVAKGFVVVIENNADAGLNTFQARKFDLCLLDVKMPIKDGFELAQEIRALDSRVPFIFLTGNTEKSDRIKGLVLGADDYITKPFSMEELFLRIRNVLKRVEPQVKQTRFEIGTFVFDSQARKLSTQKTISNLSEAEGRLLKLFCMQEDGIVSRDLALKEVWQDEDNLKGRSLNVYINKLRRHLASDNSVEILNIYGTGYQLVYKHE